MALFLHLSETEGVRTGCAFNPPEQTLGRSEDDKKEKIKNGSQF